MIDNKIHTLHTDNKGQALLLIIVVLFIVFFVVVSVSENITVDTVNTAQNQNFQKAFAAASSALSAASQYATNNAPTSLYSSSQTYGNGLYQYTYTITPSKTINQVVTPDQSVQAYVQGSNTVTVSFNDPSSILLINVINKDASNYMCLYYPQGISSYISASQFDIANAKQNPNCPAPQTLTIASNYYSANLTIANPNASNAWQYIRAQVVNYTGHSVNIVITPSANNLQEYDILAVGYYNGSRRILHSYINKYGNPPALFDYVFFNGGNNAKVSF